MISSSNKTHQITRQKNIDLASGSRRHSGGGGQITNGVLVNGVDDDVGDEEFEDDYLATVAAAAAAAMSAAAVEHNSPSSRTTAITSSFGVVEDEKTSDRCRLKKEIELINESLSKLTTQLICEDVSDTVVPVCYRQFDFNSSTIAAINDDANNNTPSTSSSSSSPSNLPNSSNSAFLNTPEHNLKSISNRSLNSTSQSSDSSSSTSVSPAPYASIYLPPPSSPSTLRSAKAAVTSLIHSHINVSPSSSSPTSTPRRLSKSPNKNVNGKQLVATNSVPLLQPKPKRLASLMRLSSNGGGSFFSRSCPGDDADGNDDHQQSHQNLDENQTNKLGTTTTTNGSNSPSKSKNSETSSRNLGKSLFAFAARASRAVKKSSVESNSSSNTSSIANLNDERSSGTSNEYSGKINGFEVDMEKLARELILPSLNTPLTSFRTSPTNSNVNLTTSSSSSTTTTTTKPPLQSSKTIDSNASPLLQNAKKKTFIRSLTTQNK